MVKNRPQRKTTGIGAKLKYSSKVGGMNVKSKGGGGSILFRPAHAFSLKY